MTNPKFQKLAQKLMANPELMQMMSDPKVGRDRSKGGVARRGREVER